MREREVYIEELDVVKDVVVVSEVVGGDDVDIGIFLDFLVGEMEFFVFFEESFLGDFVGLVSFVGFFEVMKDVYMVVGKILS